MKKEKIIISIITLFFALFTVSQATYYAQWSDSLGLPGISSPALIGVNKTDGVYPVDIDGNIRIQDNGTTKIFFDIYGGNSYLIGGVLGINTTTPTKTLYVNGSSGGSQSWSTSDKRWKKNIKTIPSALENITKIRGVTYDWKKGDKTESKGFDNKTHYGVIAQEVEAVFPNLVDNHGKDSEYKHVEYNGLVGILIEAIKERKAKNDQLRERILKLEKILQ